MNKNTSASIVAADANNAMITLPDPFKFIDSPYWYSTNTLSVENSYPPYNIREIDEDTRVWELALAGFTRDELEVTTNGRMLTISGENRDEVEGKYLHKGIATRKFTKVVTLWEYWEVESADYNDGILYVVIKRHVPEDKKPRQIKIS